MIALDYQNVYYSDDPNDFLTTTITDIRVDDENGVWGIAEIPVNAILRTQGWQGPENDYNWRRVRVVRKPERYGWDFVHKSDIDKVRIKE